MAQAHRLDEYLQASRVAIDRDRIDVEIDLTPGVAVATQVLAAIDTDHDGAISGPEAGSYASAVIDALTLELDGQIAHLQLTSQRFPDPEAMTGGTGTIQLRASATAVAGRSGTHHLLFRNPYRADIGAYLANTLVPRDAAIQIIGQQRDERQHDLRIEYRVDSSWKWALSWTGIAVLAVAGLMTIRLRRRA
jgi:hypothetical protein